MFELIVMSLLGAAFIKALKDESTEEKERKEAERIGDLKIKVFCYSVRHNMLYDQVVEKLQKKELTFKEIEND